MYLKFGSGGFTPPLLTIESHWELSNILDFQGPGYQLRSNVQKLKLS